MQVKNKLPKIVKEYKKLLDALFDNGNLNSEGEIINSDRELESLGVNDRVINLINTVVQNYNQCKTIISETTYNNIVDIYVPSTINGGLPFDIISLQHSENEAIFITPTEEENTFWVGILKESKLPLNAGVLIYNPVENTLNGAVAFSPNEDDLLGNTYTPEQYKKVYEWHSRGDLDVLNDELTPLRRVFATKAMGVYLCIHILDLINNSEMELEEHKPSKQVIRMLQKRGREVPEPYYTCNIKPKVINPVELEEGERGKGVEHGYRYDVRGHQRTLSNGNVIWVKSHQRGIKHDNYVQKKYKL